MSTKREDISQIEKYLKGQLDTKAMYQLENEAQDDLFLMEALEGFESSSQNIQTDLSVLEQRLAKRVAEQKQHKLFWWRVVPIAASLLLMVSAGWWFVSNKPEKIKPALVALNHLPKAKGPATTGASPVQADVAVAVTDQKARPSAQKTSKSNPMLAAITPKAARSADKAVYKTDTVVYKASPSNIAQNVSPATLDNLLKKMEGISVGSMGSYAYNGQPATRAKLNGKEFYGGSAKDAIKNLPADLVAKIQIVDDHGDQAFKKDSGLKKTFGATNPAVSSIGARRAPNQITPVQSNILRNEVQDNPVGTVDHLLQGKVAGLDIKNNIGAPGMRGSVNIRGLSSIPQSKPANIVIPVGYHLISGKVIDSVGQPLAAVTISMFGVGVGQTDSNGEFYVAAPPKGEFYTASVGYIGRMVEIDKSSYYTVRVQEYKRPLNEVIIRGYVNRNNPTTQNNEALADKVTVVPRAVGDTVCHENIVFRDQFFGNIGVLLKYDFEKNNGYKITVSESYYSKARKFLARYIDLNTNPYEWHKWYETNKCKNLK